MGVLGIAEANAGKCNRGTNITISGTARTAIIIRKDLRYKLREDLIVKNMTDRKGLMIPK